MSECKDLRLAGFAARVSALSVVLGGLVIALMALHVVLDVSLRYFTGEPLAGTTEIVSRYYMVTVVFLPLAYVQAGRQHINATLFSDLLPLRAQPLLGCFSAALMAIFALLLGWCAGKEAIHATAISEQIQTASYFLPTWPAKWLPVIAMALVVFQSLVDFVSELHIFVNWRAGGEELARRNLSQVTTV